MCAVRVSHVIRATPRAQLAEWVTTVASQAGVAAGDARLLASQLGAPESRLELELSFASLAELEAFFAALPVADHVAWGARLAPVVCDGSPVWHVMRNVSLATTQAAPPLPAALAPPPPPEIVRRTETGLYITGSEALEAPPQATELDWKGDPLVWAPGDKLPKFE
jgi:hypothetical protein